MTNATHKKTNRARRDRRDDRKVVPKTQVVDRTPPFEPPACLKNRAPGDKLTNSECIEAGKWLQACIVEYGRRKGIYI